MQVSQGPREKPPSKVGFHLEIVSWCRPFLWKKRGNDEDTVSFQQSAGSQSGIRQDGASMDGRLEGTRSRSVRCGRRRIGAMVLPESAGPEILDGFGCV